MRQAKGDMSHHSMIVDHDQYKKSSFGLRIRILHKCLCEKQVPDFIKKYTYVNIMYEDCSFSENKVKFTSN